MIDRSSKNVILIARDSKLYIVVISVSPFSPENRLGIQAIILFLLYIVALLCLLKL